MLSKTRKLQVYFFLGVLLGAVITYSGVWLAAANPSSSYTTISDTLVDIPGALNASEIWFDEDKRLREPLQEASYIIGQYNATHYYARNQSGYGTSANKGYEFLSDNATSIFESAWDNMGDGGTISFKGNISLSVGVTFDLQKNVKGLTIKGEGETRSIFSWTGSGYAFTFKTTDASVGYYYLSLEDFTVTGLSKTTDRHGVNITNIGRNCYVSNLQIKQCDTGLLINDTNTVFVEGFKSDTCNIGILIDGMAASVSNSNGIFLENIRISDCSNYGVEFRRGRVGGIKNAVIENCGTGIFFYRWGFCKEVQNVYFEGSTIADLNITGDSGAYPQAEVNIENCYMGSTCDYAIKVKYVRDLNIVGCTSENHAVAFVKSTYTSDEIIITDSTITDPLLHDGVGKLLCRGFDYDNSGTQATASYIISTDGTNYYCESQKQGESSELVWVSTNASQIINWADGNLTCDEFVQATLYLKGNFTINSPILIKSGTHFILDGTIWLADNSDCNMLQNAHPETYDCNVIIEGGIWYGNKEHQSSGNIMFWNITTAPSTGDVGQIYFRNLQLINACQDCLYIDLSNHGGVRIENMRFKNPGYGYYSLHMENTWDNEINDILACDKVYIKNIDMTNFDNLYINNGWTFEDAICVAFQNAFFDTSGNIPLTLKYTRYCTFNNMRIRAIGDGTDIAAAIKLDDTASGDSTHNTFNNIIIGRMGAAGTREFTYGIQETDSDQDYNIYSEVNAYDVTTSGFDIQGANSHICCSWNGTSWINVYP